MKNIYVILQILLTIAVAIGVFLIVSPYFSLFKGDSTLIKYLKKAEEFYAKDLLVKHDDFVIIDDQENSAELVINKKGEDFSIELIQPIRSIEIIKKGNRTQTCYFLFEDFACSEGEEAKLFFNALKSSLTDSEWVRNSFLDKYKMLEKKGLLKYKEEASNATLGECRLFKINYSLKQLTLEELNSINIPPESPLSFADSVYEEICIDEEGKILKWKRSLTFPKEVLGFEATEFGEPEEINLYNLSNETKFSELTSKGSRVLREIRECENDVCLRALAINERLPYICELAEKKELCIDAYMAILNDSSACKLASKYNLSYTVCEEV